MKDTHEYQYGRIGLGILGQVLFFPKVRVLKSGLRKRVGKPLTINEPFESFLNAAMHLAARDGVKLNVKIFYPKKKVATERKRARRKR